MDERLQAGLGFSSCMLWNVLVFTVNIYSYNLIGRYVDGQVMNG